MRKKKQSNQQCHLALLEPTSIKAARKTVMKLTPGCSLSYFSYEYELALPLL